MNETTTQPQITVYSTTWCGFCRSEKQYLDGKNIQYISKDIEADADAHAELMAKINGNFQGVPVTDIGGDMVLGFDREAIDAAIKKHDIQPMQAAA